jgi:hypothetical protein
MTFRIIIIATNNPTIPKAKLVAGLWHEAADIDAVRAVVRPAGHALQIVAPVMSL